MSEITPKFLRQHFRLSSGQIKRLESLAQLRGEPFNVTAAAIFRNLMNAVPTTIKHQPPLDLPVKELGMVDGFARLVLESGRELWTNPSKFRLTKIYYALRDRLPRIVEPETYGAYFDVWFRYLAYKRNPFLPKHSGAVMIDCGAYVGWKALGYHDGAPNSTVVAIEIARAAYELIERNVAVNNLEGKVIPVHCGVWNEADLTREAEFEGYASHSLLPPDQHKHYSRREIVKTDTLDNIITRLELPVVDYLNVQTNGAEQMALMGLVRHFDRVKMIYVGAHYSLDGVPQADTVSEYLLSRGCKIVGRYGGAITAVTPQWIGKVALPDERVAAASKEILEG